MTLRRKAAVVAVGAAVVLGGYFLVAVWTIVLALWVNFDETGLPSASSLPDGIAIESDGMGCGSGGCWRELIVEPAPGQSPLELAAALGLGDETCKIRNFPDPRRVCMGGNLTNDGVRVYLQYDRTLKLWPFRFTD